MAGSTSRKRGWSCRKIVIAVLASIGIFAMVATTVAAVVMPFLANQGDDSALHGASRPTPTTPTGYAPLIVRPVVQALVATPEQCKQGPPPPPSPPADPLSTCDVEQKAQYQLGPEALRLNLTGAVRSNYP
jgi:hypothetical protein